MSEEESSVLFSLKELMSIEEDRIKTEEDDRVRGEEEAERARLDAEAQARDAEEARQRAEEERRRLEEQRRREESARVEAIQHAEVETARADAEQRARMEAMTAQQAHERQLATLHHDKGKKRLRYGIIAAAAILLIGTPTAGYFWWADYQEKQRIFALKQQEADRREAEIEAKEKALEEQTRKITELQEMLAKADQDSSEAKRLREELAAAKNMAATMGGGRRIPGKSSSGGTPKTTKCAPGDPLCSDL